MTNHQEARGLVQPEADPTLLFLSMLLVKPGQQPRIEEYRRGLIESGTVISCVSFGLDRIPLKTVLEWLRHGTILS